MRECIIGPRPSAAMIRGRDRGLPLLEMLFGLRKLHDVVGGITQSHEVAPTR
jgi:hypothetical protein